MKVQKMTHLALTAEEVKAALMQYLTDKSVFTGNKELAGYLVSMATNGWDWDYGDDGNGLTIVIDGISETQHHVLESEPVDMIRERVVVPYLPWDPLRAKADYEATAKRLLEDEELDGLTGL